MRFASQGAVAAAMASSLVSATPIDYQTPAAGVDVSASVNLGHGSNSANSGNQPAHGSGLDLSALVNLGHGSNSAGSGNQPTHGSGLDLSALVNITHGSNLASSGNQPAHGSGLDLSALVNLSHESVSASVSLNKDLSGKVLAAGILAHATVGDIADVKEDLEISVTCNDCYTRGNIDVKVSLEHTVPVLSLTITDIEAKLDLDIKATDATSIAVNLLAVSALEMPFLGLDLDATVYLDLVIGVSAEVDITAGIEIELVDEAVVTTDILSGDIITAAFAGLEVDVLPIAVRIGCSELHATLRLRVELNGAVKTAAGNALSIANIVPEIGAGLELGVFVNIAEYIGLFCPDALCPLPRESYGLNIGAIVDLDVNVEDLAAHIAIVPTVSTALLSAPEATHCHPALPIIIIGGQGPLGYVTGITAAGFAIGVPTGVAGGVPTGVPTGVAGGVPTGVPTGVAGGDASASASASNGPSASGSASDNASASASDNASGSDNASASITGTATGPVTGLPSASVSGGGSSESGFPTSDITIPAGYVVSTVTQTATYTMTTCAVNVANCPGPLQGETTLVHTTVYTTVCPATAVITDMHPAPTAAESSAAAAVPHVTAVPCSSVNTFNPDGQVAYPSSSFPTTTKHAEYPTYAARNYPVESVATSTAVVPTTKHAEYPTAPAQEYPVESVGTTTAATSTTKNVEYPTAPAQEYPVESVGTTTYPVESVGTTTAGASTTEHAEYPTAPAEEYPVYPVESATTETYPVEHPTTKPAYPTAPYYPSMPVPSMHNGTATYPATHPAATTYPGVAHPTAATYPVAATYPAVTLSTYHVAPTGAYPTKPVYPTAPHSVETPVPVAGASKQVVGSGVIVAAAGVFMALF